jgi:hypothetical protein
VPDPLSNALSRIDAPLMPVATARHDLAFPPGGGSHPHPSHPEGGRGAAWRASYAGTMFRGLRRPDGSPSLRARVVAVLVVLGLVTISAPVTVPVIRWLVELLSP